MVRKGKFMSNQSFKRPFFVNPLRDEDDKMCASTSCKALKRETNRKVRRTGIDDLASGCAYKRLIEMWDFNGDRGGKLHYYIPLAPDDEEVNHVIVKGGNHYFPKKPN